MVGGAWDRMMSWYGTSQPLGGDTSGFSSAPNHKYYDSYTNSNVITACGGSICYGQALSETGRWYNNYYVNNIYDWMERGGYQDWLESYDCEMYCFSGRYGSSNDSIGTRTVLT